jgi:hypothetical protein
MTGEAVKLTARTHQSLIWDRARHVLRPRAAPREYFPVAPHAFPLPQGQHATVCAVAMHAVQTARDAGLGVSAAR